MTQRGVSFIEALVALAVIAILVGAFVVPGYRSYSASRAPLDAAATLAEDLSLLERAAQNSKLNEGASLLIVSDDPFMYRGYRGRPTSIDPNSSLGALLVERGFPGVVLAGGPINTSTPLLFASNGSAQYVSGGDAASQHATIEFLLTRPGGKTAQVDLNLFTGSVTLP